MSEIKPVYQTVFIATEFPDGWHEVDKQVHDVRTNHPDQFKTRILYPAAAYEALENERDELKQSLDDLQERFNGIKFIESELRKENDSLNAEVLQLKNELIASLKDWHDMNANHEALQKENAELKEDLQFVERWANHHGTKPNVTAQEALSCIQHYPSIAAITKSYKDGVIPNTRNPYAEIESLNAENLLLKEELRQYKTSYRQAKPRSFK